MNKIFLLFFCWLVPSLINNIQAQFVFPPGDEYDFAFQVKQIDEFFERFNGDTSTVLQTYLQENFPEEALPRKKMMGTLFDQTDESWNPTEVYAFLDQSCRPENPFLLDYYDEDWYAQVECEIAFKGEPSVAILTLKVEKDIDMASRWTLCGVQAPFLKSRMSQTQTAFLNPASHGTDFMNLEQMFANKKQLAGYLPSGYRMDMLTQFLLRMYEGEVEFRAVRDIRYHFLQLEGWLFTVQHFRRKDPNSGWLINQLKLMDQEQKSIYRKNVLHLAIP